MLVVVLELGGVAVPVSRLQLAREMGVGVVSLLATLAAARCDEHGEPTTTAHVDVRSLSCRLDEPCCASFAEKIGRGAGGDVGR